MLIALTVITPDRQHDLRLPAGVPLAVMREDLRRLTGLDDPALSSVGGRHLDDERTLLDNGIREGAILQAAPTENELMVLDDIVDAVQPSGSPAAWEPRSLAVTLFAATAISCFLGREAMQVAAGFIALVASLGMAAAPTISVRLLALTPDADPREPQTHQRVARAAPLGSRIARGAAILAATAAMALVSSGGSWSMAAGWICLLLVLARLAAQDSGIALAVISMCAVALSSCLTRGGASAAVIGCAGAVGCLLITLASRPGSPPGVRLALERSATALTISLPTLLLIAFDLVPAPWS